MAIAKHHVMVPHSKSIGEIFELYGDPDDQMLYVTVVYENTFG
jgi:hypothetical protein